MPGKKDARERLLDAAFRLIETGGPACATPEAVAAQAGAGKMSMYRHFKGKDDLIVAALTEMDVAKRRALVGEDESQDPSSRIRSMFDRLADDFHADRVGGCAYVMTELGYSGEYAARSFVAAHKAAMLDDLVHVIEPVCGERAPAVAEAISMLLDGAIIHARIQRSATPFRNAADAAVSLLGDA